MRESTPSASPKIEQFDFSFSSLAGIETNSSPISFVFGAGANMVREQEPARSNAMSQKTGNEEAPIEIPSSPVTANITSPAPIFGQPTALNITASPLAKASARNSSSQPVIRRSGGDGTYSNLFSKKRTGDPGYHKPPATGNPLSNIGRDMAKPKPSGYGLSESGYNLADGSRRPNQPASVRSEDPFIIQRPVNPPVSQRQPLQPQTFSSNFNSNPYFKPTEIVDLTKTAQKPDEDEDFNDRHVFGNDRFGTADPMMYLDARKADEDIKALLEGAMDDEDDKPRTRRKKKEADQKLDDLTKKMQGMDVKEEQDEEEEGEIDDGTREGLKVKLLPHQIDGVEWMMQKEVGKRKVKGVHPKGGILADDMGLGKTIQSIALLLANPRPATEDFKKLKLKIDEDCDRATLVVAPLALIKQWEAEIKDRVDEEHALKVKVHHGPQRTKSYKDLRNYDVVITTYQTLSSEHADGASSVKTALFGVKWYRVILDEAHSVKNRNAKTTKAAYALNSQYRWCLTGTPLQNNLDELQSLICFLQIKPYNQLDVWREQITKPMNNGRGGLSIRRLRAFLSVFMKRRTKDVLKQGAGLNTGADGKQASGTSFKIVKRTVEKVQAEFNDREQAFYDRLQDRTDKSLERMMMGGNQLSYASALVLLMRLRQACNHPQLLKGDLSKEQDALTDRSPSKRGSRNDDMDDIANMLGGLSVETQNCDICRIDLSTSDIQEGLTRCAECEEDLKLMETPKKEPKIKAKKIVKKERKINRRVITDSDDEDEEEVAHGSETEDEEEFEESGSDEEDDSETEYDSSPKFNPQMPSSSTKIRHLLKILKHDSHTHKYIVFSFFTSMLDLIEPFLKRHDLRFVRYDGAMRNDHREASLERLKTDPKVRILLCSLRAGSLGLNLTAASRVVVLEPFWNPFVEEQAIDRVHRLNQTQDVVVYKITIKNSVEERILELQEKKRELANATIEGQKLGAGKLSLQELMNLFKHDSEKDAKLDMIGLKDGRSLLDRDSYSTTGPSKNTNAGETARHASKIGKSKTRVEDPIWGRR